MNYKEKIILQHIALLALLDKKEQSQEQKVKLEEIFPELKEVESKDKKIRRVIRGWIYTRPASFFDNGISKEEMLAWLEKQVSPQMVVDAYLRGCNDTEKKWLEKQGESDETKAKMFLINKGYPIDANGIFPTYEEMYNIIRDGLEQQVSQKPTDKFNVGDWLVFKNKHQSIYQVEKIEDWYYILRHTHGGTFRVCVLHDESLRLWTIQDAKDGDVLCDYHEEYDNPLIFILKKFEHVNFGLVRPSDYSSYCFLTAGDIQRFKEGRYHHKHNIKPATKEQRDLLFQKMKEAGYEWVDNKKELKKIEQKM